MKIAYFINQYPKVSHSFIRREIRALEKRGIIVDRYAVRVDRNELVDWRDIAEFEKTNYLLGTTVWKTVAAVALVFISHPIRFVSILCSAFKLGRRSDRGILKHVLYFMEACLLKKWSDESDVCHVHAHFGTNSTMVAMLCRRLGGPRYSFTVHGPEEFDKPESISLGEKIQRSDFTVAVSSYGRSQLYRWTDNSNWGKIHVVHCGLEADFHREPPAVPCSSNAIVCVGRICEQKGQLLLIEVVARMVEQGKIFFLTLAGDGPMRAEAEQMVDRYDLGEYVRITGWINSEQVRDEILKARALVLPSFAEGLPVVIMEAMALGCPVLSTYVAGIPELVIHRENGWLVPAGDCQALTRMLEEILQMAEDDLQRLGKNAKKRVMKRHSIDTEAGKLLNLFKAYSAEDRQGG